MSRKAHTTPKSRKQRSPRIRVPNQERALFEVNAKYLVGVIQRLSLTGGSAILSKGPIPQGTLGEMALNTVFGKVNAHVEFLHTCADGIPLAQAFRFVAMDEVSQERFNAAAKQMMMTGFGDETEQKRSRLDDPASEVLGGLLTSVRRLAAKLTS